MPNGQQDFSPQAIQNRILAGASPLFRQGAQAVRQATAGATRRRGIVGAGDISRQATAGLGQALGQTALKAGQTGEQMAAEFEAQRRGLEQQLEMQRRSLEQQKTLEANRLAEMVAARQQQAQMQLFPHIGLTPGFLEEVGLELPGRQEQRQFQRQIGQLGLPGFPFGGQGGGQGQFGLAGLGGSTNLQLQRMFPGMSRGGRLQMAMNLGLLPGAIQPGQFQR